MESIRSSLAGLTVRRGLTLLACVVLAGVAEGALPEKAFELGQGSESLMLNADGAFLGWGSGSAETATARSSSAGEIRYGGNILKLTQPIAVSREGRGGSGETATARSSSAGEIRYGGNILKLTQPIAVSREGGGVSLTYRWPGEPKLEVIAQHR